MVRGATASVGLSDGATAGGAGSRSNARIGCVAAIDDAGADCAFGPPDGGNGMDRPGAAGTTSAWGVDGAAVGVAGADSDPPVSDQTRRPSPTRSDTAERPVRINPPTVAKTLRAVARTSPAPGATPL